MIYFTWPAFFYVVLPMLLVIVFFATDWWRKWKISVSDGNPIQGLIIIGVVILCIFFLMDTEHKNSSYSVDGVTSYIKGARSIKAEEYSEVLYIGEKKVSLNPADNKLYIHLGTGRMIGFDEVVSNSMCRACGQFSKRDTMPVHAYQITQKGWFQSSRVFFSKERDIVLEEAMSIPIK